MDFSKLKPIRLDDEIYLRPVVASDVDEVLRLVVRNTDHLMAFMEWAKPDYSGKDAQEWIDRYLNGLPTKASLNFGIFRGETMIGTIGFAYFDHDAHVTEIGYWIDHEEEGKGLVTRSCQQLLDLAFGELGMDRVQIRCASGNLRSAAIPERLGFTKEGVQREHVVRHGNVYDFWIYGILRREWEDRRSQGQ